MCFVNNKVTFVHWACVSKIFQQGKLKDVKSLLIFVSVGVL